MEWGVRFLLVIVHLTGQIGDPARASFNFFGEIEVHSAHATLEDCHYAMRNFSTTSGAVGCLEITDASFTRAPTPAR